jgi:general secretion pathway protein M
VNWWRALGERDRWALVAGTVLLLAALFYLLIWEPLGERQARLETRVAEQHEQLAWMREARSRIQALASASAPAPTASGASLLSTIDQAASSNGLQGAIKRVAPEGDHQVRVWLGEAPYAAVLRWLETLQHQGIMLETLQMEQHATPGRIEARVLVGRSG